MVRPSARHGHSSSRGACAMVERAAPIISPQDGDGGTTPRPRKERPDSSTTAEAAERLNCTSTGPATLGRMVTQHDAKAAGAERAHRLHIVLRSYREDARIDDAHEARQVEQRQHRDQGAGAGPEQRHHQQRKQQRREAQHDVHAAHRQQLGEPAEKTAGQAQHHAEKTGDRRSATVTRKETRAPQISRESTSRPYSSSPSGCAPDQPARRWATSIFTGSGSGSIGAASAMSAMAATDPAGPQPSLIGTARADRAPRKECPPGN